MKEAELIHVPFKEGDRELVRQLWCKGCPPKMIAEITGFKESAVRMVLKRIMPKGARLA